jgi:hypothetical protein
MRMSFVLLLAAFAALHIVHARSSLASVTRNGRVAVSLAGAAPTTSAAVWVGPGVVALFRIDDMPYCLSRQPAIDTRVRLACPPRSHVGAAVVGTDRDYHKR